MRLFIAIRFTDEINRQILSCMHDMKQQGVKGSFVPGSNLHMTLAFIGETDRVKEIREVMQSIDFQPFRLNFSGFGSFGSTYWLGTKGSQKLQSTVRQLREGLQARGIPFDEKPFSPHVTLVRKVLLPRGYQAPSMNGNMMVEKISLMKSARVDGKMVYTEIFSRGV